MKKKRYYRDPPAINSIGSADTALFHLIEAKKALEDYEIEREAVLAALDSRFDIRTGFSLAELRKWISGTEKAVAKWADKDIRKNPDIWKGKKLRLTNGTIMFQTSPGKVSLIKKVARTFDAAVQLLASSRRIALKKFLRRRPDDLNRELLLQEFEDGRITNDELQPVGLKISKPEICRIELKK